MIITLGEWTVCDISINEFIKHDIHKRQKKLGTVPEVLAETGEYKSMTVNASWADVNLDVTKCSSPVELVQHTEWLAPETLVLKRRWRWRVIVDGRLLDAAAQHVRRLRPTDGRLWRLSCRRMCRRQRCCRVDVNTGGRQRWSTRVTWRWRVFIRRHRQSSLTTNTSTTASDARHLTCADKLTANLSKNKTHGSL